MGSGFDASAGKPTGTCGSWVLGSKYSGGLKVPQPPAELLKGLTLITLGVLTFGRSSLAVSTSK